MDPGDFAVRGGIIDIYPPGREEPVRLDFFGDALESIRTFDPQSQRTTGQLHQLSLHPANEVILNSEAVKGFRTRYAAAFTGVDIDDPLYEAVTNGRRYQGMEHWLPLFYERLETIFDYVGDVGHDARPSGRRRRDVAVRADRRLPPGPKRRADARQLRQHALQAAAAGCPLSFRRRLDERPGPPRRPRLQPVRRSGNAGPAGLQCRRARGTQLRARARALRHERLRGGARPYRRFAEIRQAGRHRSVDGGRGGAARDDLQGPRRPQHRARRKLGRDDGPSRLRDQRGRPRARIRFRDGRLRHHRRAGHPRRPPGAAKPEGEARRRFHLRAGEPVARRPRRPRRPRHRPIRRAADDRGAGRPPRLPVPAVCRRRPAVPAGREYRAPVALRLRGGGGRARQARRRGLAVAQGAPQEAGPRDRRGAHQDGGGTRAQARRRHHARRRRSTTSSAPASPTRRRTTSSPPFKPRWRISAAGGPWTGSSAATSGSARRKWRCGRPSSRR